MAQIRWAYKDFTLPLAPPSPHTLNQTSIDPHLYSSCNLLTATKNEPT